MWRGVYSLHCSVIAQQCVSRNGLHAATAADSVRERGLKDRFGGGCATESCDNQAKS